MHADFQLVSEFLPRRPAVAYSLEPASRLLCLFPTHPKRVRTEFNGCDRCGTPFSRHWRNGHTAVRSVETVPCTRGSFQAATTAPQTHLSPVTCHVAHAFSLSRSAE